MSTYPTKRVDITTLTVKSPQCQLKELQKKKYIKAVNDRDRSLSEATPTRPLFDRDGLLRYKAEDRAEIIACGLEQQSTPHEDGDEEFIREVEDSVRNYLATSLSQIDDGLLVTPSEVAATRELIPAPLSGATESPAPMAADQDQPPPSRRRLEGSYPAGSLEGGHQP
ncbi:unnamed protein product [Danaus chrysippus]|uniref:(African queen) hypothetical protein n=1 Tax=Danaus chrysippus TaxID=151541 RepID=A0A8J2QD47_9NEOP|nr:unnamed protein product [Danaus chrysippus]